MQIKLLSFQNVVAGQTATVDLRNLFGKVIDRIVLQLGGTFTKAQISGIRIKANGKVIFDDTGSRIDSRMQYRGIAASATFLTVDFSEIRAKDMLDQKLGSLDTLKGITTLTMEVDIAAGAVSPTLTGIAECSWQSSQLADTAGLIGKVLNYTHPATASTTKFPLNIPYGKFAGTLIKRIHLFVGAGTITFNGMEVRKNGVTIYESTAAFNNFILGEYGRTPQAGVYHLDFIEDGNFFGGVLNAAEAQTMEYYADITVTAAGNIVAVAELLDTLENN